MSERWFVKCMDCNDRVDGGINHGVREMRAALAARHALEELHQVFTDRGLTVDVSIDGIRHLEGYTLTPEWWVEHKGHALKVVNEYGDVDKEGES